MAGLPGARAGGPATRGPARGLAGLAASPRFQALAARLPGLRHLARAEGAALFDVMQGFVRSQALAALVELRVLHALADGPRHPRALAPAAGLGEARMALLLQSGAALRLLRRRRDGRFALTARGAAFLSVPGLEALVRHHAVLYRDLADPVAFLRGETAPDLARFWPYVFGAGQATDPEAAAAYSGLMADTQALVAADTLRLVDFGGVARLLDVGGGTGAFLAAVGRAHPSMRLDLFDLPAVMEGAAARLGQAGLSGRVTLHRGSFRDDPLPAGADAVSLVRVLYDHADATVASLLRAVLAALPPGGRIVVSEPMSGGDRPDPATDVYFAWYTAAMGTGRTRSAAEIGALMAGAGFQGIRSAPGDRRYVTSVVEARRPA